MDFPSKIRNFLNNTGNTVSNYLAPPVRSPIPLPKRRGFGDILSDGLQTGVNFVNAPFDQIGKRTNEITRTQGTGGATQRIINTFPKAANVIGEELFGGLLGNSQPARVAGRIVGGFSSVAGQGPVQLGAGLEQLTKKNTRMQGLKNTAIGALKSGLTARGATHMTPAFAAVGTGLSTGIGALQGKDIAQSVGEGFGQSLKTRGVTSLTDPVIYGSTGLAKSLVPANIAGQEIIGRTLSGVGNVVEDEILAKLDGLKTNSLDKTLAFGLGALSSGGTKADWDTLSKHLKNGVSDIKEQFQIDNLIEQGKQTGLQPRDVLGRYMKQSQRGLKKAKEFIKDANISDAQRRLLRESLGLDIDPEAGAIKFDEPLIGSKPKTIGDIQQSTQNPDLTAYENAFKLQDFKKLNEISAKYPGDSRFKVHERFKPEVNLRKTVPRGSYTNIPQLDNPLINSGKGAVKSPDQILNQAKSEIGRKDSIKKSISNSFDELYTDWVNRFHPVEKLVGEIEKGSGLKIESGKNPIYQIKRLLGAGGVAELRHKKELEPIIKELGDIDKSDFDVFMKAKRDVELAGRGIYGSNTEVAQERIKALSQKYDVNKLDQVAEQLYTYQSQGLEKLKEAGFLSDESVKNITAQNQKYVPFERIRDEIDNYLGLPTAKLQQSSSPVQKIKGSDLSIESPLESIVANTYKIEAAVAKNNVAKSIVNLSNVDPKYSNIFTKVKSGDGNAIAVWENGKKQFYSAPREIVAVVKGLNEENMGTLLKILSVPASFFRQQTTGRNPGFFVPNLVRDQFDAAINAKHGYVPFYDYLQGMGHLINHKYRGGDDLVEQWYKSGGSIFFDNMGGRKDIGIQIKDATKQRGLIEKGIRGLVSGIDFLSEFSEKPTRLGVFKRALKATGDTNVAAFESREATLDFARMGARMKIANSLIPFLNVEVQGFDKMIRSAREHPGKTTLTLAGLGMLPQTLISLYNNHYHGDDYALVPDFEKEDNFILLTGGKDREGNPSYIKIPKGHIQKIITQPTDNFITWLAGNNPQTFQQFALSMLSSSVPLVGDGNNLSDIASRTVGGLTPQFAKPVTEAVMNRDTFKNRAIVDLFTEKLPPAAQFYSTTPEWYKSLGRQVNVSPAKLQHLAEGYGGGATKETNNLVTTAQDIAAGNPLELNKIPLARRFVGSYSGFDMERSEEDPRPLDINSEIKLRDLKLKAKQTAQKSISPSTRLMLDRAKRDIQIKGSEEQPKTMEMGFFDNFFKKADKYEEKDETGDLSALEQEYMDDIAKEKLKYSDEKYAEENDRIYFKKGKEVHIFEKTFDANPPALTGNKELDAEIVKDYKSSISTRINDIKDLYDVGKFSAQEAEQEIQKLRAIYETSSKGKKKSIKGVSFKIPRLKTQKRLTLKSSSVKPLSLPKLPELRSNLKALTFKGRPLKLKKGH